MNKFKIGDRVEVINDKFYTITKKGSKGIVRELGSLGSIYVEFNYIPNDSTFFKSKYYINPTHLKIIEKRDIKELYQELKQPYIQ